MHLYTISSSRLTSTRFGFFLVCFAYFNNIVDYADAIIIRQAGGPSNLLMDLAANEKAVHADFFNGMYPFSTYK